MRGPNRHESTWRTFRLFVVIVVEAAPISCRLVRPSELDLMARLACLRLVDRSGGWLGEPFTPSSPFRVSVCTRT